MHFRIKTPARLRGKSRVFRGKAAAVAHHAWKEWPR